MKSSIVFRRLLPKYRNSCKADRVDKDKCENDIELKDIEVKI